MHTDIQTAREWPARHHGVITRDRARQLGLTNGQIDTFLTRGEWRAVQRGVFVATASPASPHQQLLAAVAAGGPGAAASHLSAAWLHRLVDGEPPEPWVTVPVVRRRRIRGATVHRSRAVAVSAVDGIPASFLERTLIDCASVATIDIGPLVDRALVRRRLDIPELGAGLGELDPRQPGVARLRDHLEQRRYTGGPVPSVLEGAFDRLVESAGVPVPVAEYPVLVDGVVRHIDRAYPELRLGWEVDGRAYHATPEQVAADHRRRNGLAYLGWTVVVFTWHDVVHLPDAVVVDLRTSFAAATAAAGSAATKTTADETLTARAAVTPP